MIFQATGKKNWADFVGKWPPTFLLVGLYHKLLRPGNENAMGQAANTALVPALKTNGRRAIVARQQALNAP